MNATILVLQLRFYGMSNSAPIGGPFLSASECVEQVQRYNDSPGTMICTGPVTNLKCPPTPPPAKCYQETVPVKYEPQNAYYGEMATPNTAKIPRLRDATKENRK